MTTDQKEKKLRGLSGITGEEIHEEFRRLREEIDHSLYGDTEEHHKNPDFFWMWISIFAILIGAMLISVAAFGKALVFTF